MFNPLLNYFLDSQGRTLSLLGKELGMEDHEQFEDNVISLDIWISLVVFRLNNEFRESLQCLRDSYESKKTPLMLERKNEDCPSLIDFENWKVEVDKFLKVASSWDRKRETSGCFTFPISKSDGPSFSASLDKEIVREPLMFPVPEGKEGVQTTKIAKEEDRENLVLSEIGFDSKIEVSRRP